MSLIASYPNFNYHPGQIRKFLPTASVVTLMFKDGSIDHFTPENINDFIAWLSAHNVEDIKAKFAI